MSICCGAGRSRGRRSHRFVLAQHGMSTHQGIVHLRDGSEIDLWGIQGPGTSRQPSNRDAEREIEALTRLWDAATGSRSHDELTAIGR